jgi:hypothetical protein
MGMSMRDAHTTMPARLAPFLRMPLQLAKTAILLRKIRVF